MAKHISQIPTTEYKAALNGIYAGSLIGKYSCKKLKNKNQTLSYVHGAFILYITIYLVLYIFTEENVTMFGNVATDFFPVAFRCLETSQSSFYPNATFLMSNSVSLYIQSDLQIIFLDQREKSFRNSLLHVSILTLLS